MTQSAEAAARAESRRALASLMIQAADALWRLSQLSKGIVGAEYELYAHGGTIRTEKRFYKGDLATGNLSKAAPRSSSVAHSDTLGDAAIAALSSGVRWMTLHVGLGYALWVDHRDEDWAGGEPPIHVLRCEPGTAARLASQLTKSTTALPLGEALRQVGPNLAPGEVVQIYGVNIAQSSHHRARAARIMAPLMPERHEGDAESVANAECPLRVYLRSPGCRHYVWRTGADQPPAVLIFNDNTTLLGTQAGNPERLSIQSPFGIAALSC